MPFQCCPLSPLCVEQCHVTQVAHVSLVSSVIVFVANSQTGGIISTVDSNSASHASTSCISCQGIISLEHDDTALIESCTRSLYRRVATAFDETLCTCSPQSPIVNRYDVERKHNLFCRTTHISQVHSHQPSTSPTTGNISCETFSTRYSLIGIYDMITEPSRSSLMSGTELAQAIRT